MKRQILPYAGPEEMALSSRSPLLYKRVTAKTKRAKLTKEELDRVTTTMSAPIRQRAANRYHIYG